MNTQVYKSLNENFLTWRSQRASRVQQALLAGFMAALTGLMAQVSVPLPFTPVPVTGQTFAVLLSGVILGARLGSLSQVIYVVAGGLGVPWFTSQSAGMGVVFGPTGGYLLGFVVTAFVLGSVVDRYSWSKDFKTLFPFMLAINLLLIFLPGLLGLALWFGVAQGEMPGFNQILILGFYPFVPGAIIKTALAAGLACAIKKNS